MKTVIILLWVFFFMTPGAHGNNIKQPNVSGQFYSANPGRLAADIDQFFKEADVAPTDKEALILIAPHAGYVYSGGVAAYGYKALSHKAYRTIVVISPSHHYPFDGVSIWKEGAFTTPLGDVPVDSEFAAKLLEKNEAFINAPQAFDREHALEVHLPFLQKTFKDFKIVPVIFGQPGKDLCESFADSLDALIGDRQDVLIVVSSDMSHYHDDRTARDKDRRTIQAIENLALDDFWTKTSSREFEMCGSHPVTAALFLARKRGLKPQVLKYANSGDVSGDKGRVVGYTSILFYKPGGAMKAGKDDLQKEAGTPEGVAPLTRGQKARLIEIARKTIQDYILNGTVMNFQEADPRLSAEEGAFVTLHKRKALRGCIGNIVARGPLYLTVRDMAIAAATQDPRFPAVTKEELDHLDIEISVLSQPRRCRDVREIEMGTHGVIVRKGIFHQGVFLPQVATETGWNREQFLSNLCAHKAGLPPDAWKDPKIQIEIFTADVFSQQDLEAVE
jgi:AmmeMemoRadiSam system protein B/AmmeMemoRadiSam system protein A